jgi:hypothetical protein
MKPRGPRRQGPADRPRGLFRRSGKRKAVRACGGVLAAAFGSVCVSPVDDQASRWIHLDRVRTAAPWHWPPHADRPRPQHRFRHQHVHRQLFLRRDARELDAGARDGLERAEVLSFRHRQRGSARNDGCIALLEA